MVDETTLSDFSAGDVEIFNAAANPDKVRLSSRHVTHDDNANVSDEEYHSSEEGDVDHPTSVQEFTQSGPDTTFVPTMNLLEEQDDIVSHVSKRSDVSVSRSNAHRTSAIGAFEMHMQKATSSADEHHEKQSLLLDLERLRLQNIHPSKQWTLDDDIDDIRYELKRLTLHVDESANIGMMRNSLQLACTGIEMMSQRFGILDLGGWSEEVCRDMNKYDRSLGMIYRKYWKRSQHQNPEMDILMGLTGSAAMYHFRKTLTRHMVSPNRTAVRRPEANTASRPRTNSRPRTPDISDDDEDLPP